MALSMANPTVWRTKERGPGTLDATGITRYRTKNSTTEQLSMPSWYSTATWSQEYEFMEGRNTRNFHRLVRKGVLLPHTYFSQHKIVGTQEGHYSVTGSDGWTTYYVGGYPRFKDWMVDITELNAYTPSDSELDELIQGAAARIISKGHDTLTFLAELRDLRKLYRSTAEKLRAVRRPPKRIRVARLGDKLADAWLEWRYGWRPLLGDLKNLHKAATEFDTSRKRYSERTGRSYSSVTTDRVTGSFSSSSYERITNDSINVSIRGSVTADIIPPRWRFDPLKTAWELVPYSFVVDWFYNLGQSIDAVSFELYSQAHAASSGYHLTLTRQTEFNPTGFNSGYSGSYGQTGLSTLELSVRKPGRVPKVPFVSINLDEYKILDLALLVKQRLK